MTDKVQDSLHEVIKSFSNDTTWPIMYDDGSHADIKKVMTATLALAIEIRKWYMFGVVKSETELRNLLKAHGYANQKFQVIKDFLAVEQEN